MRVLLANEPCSCREVFARAFRALRTHVEVITVEPDALEGEAPRLRPDVACSHITPALRSDTYRSWRPYPGLETLLAFVDRNESNLEDHRDTGGRR